MARSVGKIGLALWAVAALLCATFDRAWASDARPRISIDGRPGTECNSAPQWQVKHLCVVPMPRLMAFPERYNGKYIELRGFLVRKFDHVLLFNDRDSIAIFRFYEGVELEEYHLPTDVMSALEKGPVPVVVIGSFDSTYQGEGSFLGGLTNIKNVAILADIPEK